MVVSVGYVLIYNMLDTTIKSIDDVEEATKLTVIAVLPTLVSFDKASVGSKNRKAKRGGKKR